MLGRSAPMRRLYQQLRKVARSEASVLLQGECGCGKEMAAHAIHSLSSRAGGPFVTVRCATLSSTPGKGEPFGQEKGSAGAANGSQPGHIEAARGGVLFLDEVGGLPMQQQTRLLQALEEEVDFDDAGGSTRASRDVRLLATTHENLAEAVAEGEFLEDLYYYLNELEIEVPALRSRGSDIELLAHYFLNRYRADSDLQPVKGFDWQALAVMQSHPWPGNVRELMSRVRSALVRTDTTLISVQDLGLAKSGSALSSAASTLEFSRAECDRRCIEHALALNNHNISRAARALGVSRTTLYRLMDKLAINPES